eukprot:CAMPEP_0179268918 /NCGR_PEP_ID=MMETSP0797-20121207/30690_1 /TAXON_ID=47934 /ORGANISM="Dinophysis acuminata, Strain DAEP01" /LENGTH=92 /DNA_ID=CAMNT_0020977219 /DNA_START=63 /DNA_END=341 /DNA_ORIENTATION=-
MCQAIAKLLISFAFMLFMLQPTRAFADSSLEETPQACTGISGYIECCLYQDLGCLMSSVIGIFICHMVVRPSHGAEATADDAMKVKVSLLWL